MGLHARPAAMLMVKMLHVSSSVEIICGDRRADGKDVMSIMAMNTVAGDEVTFRIDGPEWSLFWPPMPDISVWFVRQVRKITGKQ